MFLLTAKAVKIIKASAGMKMYFYKKIPSKKTQLVICELVQKKISSLYIKFTA